MTCHCHVTGVNCREGRDCPAREKAAAEFADLPITMEEPEVGTMADAAMMVMSAITLIITLVLIGAGVAFIYTNWSLIVAIVSH